MLEYHVTWFVWSSGLEDWEPIHPTSDEIASFTYLHSKTKDSKHVAICLDLLGRYVAGLHS